VSSDPNSHGQNGDRQPAAAWEELLSAYVDGEVNDVERELIERRCAQDPVARQLRDEWLALSAAIRTLPRPQAPVELETAVARSTPPSWAAPISRSAPTVAPSIDLPVKKRPMLRRREWFAGFTALLASLIVVATLPWEQESGDNLVLITGSGEGRVNRSRDVRRTHGWRSFPAGPAERDRRCPGDLRCR
jgi:hypothetical protein